MKAIKHYINVIYVLYNSALSGFRALLEKRSYETLIGIIATGFLLTVIPFFQVRNSALDAFHTRFDHNTSMRAHLVKERLEECLLAPRTLRHYISTTGQIRQRAFTAIIRSFIAEHVELKSVQWVQGLPDRERASFEQIARMTDNPGFFIFEHDSNKNMVPAKKRDYYYPVLYAEPGDTKIMSVPGFDIGSTKRRFDALKQARDSGETTASERIPLAEKEGRFGIVVFVPVYRNGMPAVTIEDRRASLMGFVMSVFWVDPLIRSTLEKTEPLGINFDLIDFSAPRDKRLLSRWTARLQTIPAWTSVLIPSPPTKLKKFTFAGRTWGMDFTATRGYMVRNYPLAHWLILPFGFILTAIIAFYFHHISTQRRELEHLVTVRTGRLRESEERYHRITNSITDYIYTVHVVNGHAVRTVHGDACEMITGYRSKEYDDDPYLWFRMIHEDDRAAVMSHLNSVLAGEQPQILEHRIVHKDGSIRWVRNTQVPHRNADGALVSCDGLINDITERKRAEEALAKSEQKYRTMVDFTYDWEFWIDPAGSYVYVSPSCERITGHRAEEFINDPAMFEKIVDPEDRMAVHRHMAESQNACGNNTLAFRIHTLSGETRWIEHQCQTVYDDRGTVLGRRGSNRDITDRREAECKLEESYRQMEELLSERTESLKEKEMLLKEVHHRVKNNMQIIISLINMKSSHIDNDVVARILHDCQCRIYSMALIHEQLYRSENFGKIDFEKYIVQLLDELFRMLGVDRGRIKVDLATKEIYLGLDQAIPFGIVLNELLTNSIKYAFPPDVGREGNISISIRENGETLEAVVSDNGIGVGERRDDMLSGTFGLTMAAMIIEKQLKGTMSMSNSQGTTFIIRIPIDANADSFRMRKLRSARRDENFETADR